MVASRSGKADTAVGLFWVGLPRRGSMETDFPWSCSQQRPAGAGEACQRRRRDRPGGAFSEARPQAHPTGRSGAPAPPRSLFHLAVRSWAFLLLPWSPLGGGPASGDINPQAPGVKSSCSLRALSEADLRSEPLEAKWHSLADGHVELAEGAPCV